MPIKGTIIFADNQTAYNIQNSEGVDTKGMQISNPKKVLIPYSVPGTFSFSVAFIIYGLENGIYDLRFEMISLDDKKTIDANISEFRVKRSINEEIPIEFQNVNVGLNIQNALFKNKGEQKCRLYINGKVIAEDNVFVSSVE
ncbi:MAG: hypothetical protein ABF539_08225 [Liquorilactobacillus nagelii]|jgi:hypothetical protein|uniref:hypothetical protein n=1 Tax=Liquorilactobacillus nagelii TaxID=82688 RepID=UPI0039EB550F